MAAKKATKPKAIAGPEYLDVPVSLNLTEVILSEISDEDLDKRLSAARYVAESLQEEQETRRERRDQLLREKREKAIQEFAVALRSHPCIIEYLAPQHEMLCSDQDPFEDFDAGQAPKCARCALIEIQDKGDSAWWDISPFEARLEFHFS